MVDKAHIGLFIPCYNEEENIFALYTRLNDVLNAIDGYSFSIVFSDNKSTDNTRQILTDLAEKDSRVKLILNRKNFGPGRSGAYGMFNTPGAAVICLAADLQDPPELIPGFLKKWEEGAKIVWGRNPSSEEKGSLSLFRKLYYPIMNWFTEDNLPTNISGFGLYDREVIKELVSENNPDPNFRYSIIRLGYDVETIDYVKPNRAGGKSSYNFLRYFELSLRTLASSSEKPAHLIVYVGTALVGIFSVVFIILTILSLVLKSAVLGLFSACALIALLISGVLLAVGIMSEYLNIVLKRLKNEPLVYEEGRVNFTE